MGKSIVMEFSDYIRDRYIGVKGFTPQIIWRMKLIYEIYHDKGFEIIAFSVDEDLDALKAMIEKEELPWLNASEVLSKEKNMADSRTQYNIIAYPTSILIGKDGKVIRADARGNILFEELQKMF